MAKKTTETDNPPVTDSAEQAPAKPAPVRVRLDPAKRPGVKACGAYLVGKVYTVPAEEAERLIAHKGFTQVQE